VASLGTILAKGDRGFTPSLEMSSSIELDADDPTPGSWSLNLIAEQTDVSGPVYGLDVVSHRGAKGDPGSGTITPGDYSEDPQLGWFPAVAAGLTSFELVPQKYSQMYWPATVTDVPSGTTAGFTMTTIPIAAAPFDRYVIPTGEVQVAASSGTNLRVDLVAHLDDETGTKIVGRSYGRAGASDKLSLIGYPPAGTTSSATKILAGNTANVYFRTEKQAGSSSYSSVAGTGLFGAMTVPA
jgi:hypothetical protein